MREVCCCEVVHFRFFIWVVVEVSYFCYEKIKKLGQTELCPSVYLIFNLQFSILNSISYFCTINSIE